MAATLLVMAPVIVAVLPRPEGVRRGRDADGGEGMKIAVIGAGSTYTPELVSGSARRSSVASRARAARRRRRAAARSSAAWPGACSTAPATRGRSRSRASSTARSTAPTSCSCRSASAARRRGLRDETVPLALRLHRPGDDGRRRLREGDAHRAGGARDRRARARARRADGAWIVDFTNPVGIVTRALLDAGHRAVGLCNVAIGFQRQFAQLLGVEPRRVLVDQVGLNHLTWVRARAASTARTCLPELLADARRRARRTTSACRGALLDELGAIPSLLPALLLRARRGARGAARRRAARAAVVAEIERELLELYRDPALDEKPALLDQRGGAFYSEAAIGLVALALAGDGAVHVVDMRNERHARRARGRRRRRGARARRRAPARCRCPSARWRPSCSGSSQHVAAYERLAGRGRGHARPASTARKALLAHPLIGQTSAGRRPAASDLLARRRAR